MSGIDQIQSNDLLTSDEDLSLSEHELEQQPGSQMLETSGKGALSRVHDPRGKEGLFETQRNYQDIYRFGITLTGNVADDDLALEKKVAEEEKKFLISALLRKRSPDPFEEGRERRQEDEPDESDSDIQRFIKKVRRAADQCVEASVNRIVESPDYREFVLKILAESVRIQLDKLKKREQSWILTKVPKCICI